MNLLRGLPKRLPAILLAALVVVVAGSAIALAGSFQSAPQKKIVLIPTATPSPTATPTPSPTPTPRPTPTPTPRPAPTATPFPTGPNPPGNWMSVYVDYSYAGCHVNSTPKAYPALFVTNTYPNRGYILFWGGVTTSPNFAPIGNAGAEIEGGKTEVVEIQQKLAKPVGSLIVTLYTYPYPQSMVQGHWQATVRPCY